MVSNNENYLKIISRKSLTKKLWNFSGAPEVWRCFRRRRRKVFLPY